MTRDKAITRLAWSLGFAFIVLGLAETTRVIGWGGGGLAFWFLSLCGGGGLILVGAHAVPRGTWRSSALVAVGCLTASVASMWTVLLPVLALTLLVLTVTQSPRAEDPASS